MESSKEELQQKAFALTKKYELENTNCAQCVIAGVMDTLGVTGYEDVFRAATGFADGVGLSGDGTCGALSGGVMAISHLYGRKYDEFNRRGKIMKALLLSKQLHGMFKERFGACRCHDIQTKLFGRSFNLLDPADSEAATKAGVMDKCTSLSGDTASMTVGIILDQREKDAVKPSST